MYLLDSRQQIPLQLLKPDETARNSHFRVYNFTGDITDQSDLLVPHRKDYYLLVFIRRAGGVRQWVDMMPYALKDNTIYFTRPNQIIVKEEFKQLWSTGVAFTKEFLLFQDNTLLNNLPLIQNSQNGYELLLTADDIPFIEDLLSKINDEYQKPGEWQHRMLAAYLGVLLTYLSRLSAAQFKENVTEDNLLLKRYQAKIEECFHELHEVGDYASLLHISAGHLSEVVKRQSGKPAIKHIHERLVLEARRLLFHTPGPLKEVAFKLGFTEASYFNRFFKRETGITPAEYRASIRKMYH